MTPAKVGRPGKSQRICNGCKQPCSPKNGDWFVPSPSSTSQVFLCKECERLPNSQYRRATPVR